jgi:DNA polymerase-3 subunit delta'
MPWGLVGVDGAKKALSEMLRSGRLAHALLFCGPQGGGKRSLALALAQALNCAGPAPDLSPCGECPSCAKIAGGQHPDVSTVAPTGKRNTIAIDDVRALRDYLAFRPYEARVRVAIIRQADRLGAEAGGALLKTLEEPSPDTVLVLTAESESGVMETLVSRCVRVKLAPLSRPQVLETLGGKGIAPRAAFLLAGLSGGTIGAALGLDQDEALGVWDAIDRVMGLPSSAQSLRAAFDWIGSLAENIEELRKRDDSPMDKIVFLDLVLGCLRLWWRDVSVLAATGDQGRLLGPPPSPAQRRQAQGLTARRVASLEAAVARLADGLGRSLRADLLFENYWLDVLR